MTREDVIRRIVGCESERRPLAEDAVQRSDPELHEAACEHFGTWETALRYAGINIKRLDRDVANSRDSIRRGIGRLCQRSRGLTASTVSRRHPHLYKAAVRLFGSWNKALEAAGVNSRHVRPYSTKNRPDRSMTLNLLIQRHRAGRSIRWSDLYREDRAFATIVKSRFRSLRNALFAAGIAAQPGPRARRATWTPQVVLEDLREWTQRGLPSDRIWNDDPVLACAAWRFFGGIWEALSATKIDPSTHDGAPVSAPVRAGENTQHRAANRLLSQS